MNDKDPDPESIVRTAWNDVEIRELTGVNSWFEVWSPKIGLLGNGPTALDAWQNAISHPTINGGIYKISSPCFTQEIKETYEKAN